MSCQLADKNIISRHDILAGVKRIVIKIGSRLLASVENGLNLELMQALIADIAKIRSQGKEVILVSSGAVLAGRTKLGLKKFGLSISLKQAAAAVGQSRLMHAYEKLFNAHDICSAQVLLTRDDLTCHRRYLNARHTIFTLLDYKVIPIINENDTVVVEEIKVGDNDNLSALVSNLAEADLLIILTDVDGLCSADPCKDKNARLIKTVKHINNDIHKLAGKERAFGTGGMISKLQAACSVTCFGIPAIIANGHRPGIISRIINADEVGTLFLAQKKQIPSRKHWIAHVLKVKGMIILDEGAKLALCKKGRSLLPSGILAVRGRFGVGDMVSCVDIDKKEIARGLTNYSSHEIDKIKGCNSSEIEMILHYKPDDEIIHRNNLVLV